MHAFLLIAALATSQWAMSDASPSGTLSAPLVLTGNNASGTGTLRIRPADADAALVLCEATDNASPEVCTSVTHLNFSTTDTYGLFATNLYYQADGSGGTRYNTAFGAGYIQTRSGTSNTGNGVYIAGYSVAGGALTHAYSLLDSGGTTATWTFMSTTTVDMLGKLTNSGSSPCNSISAGAVCINDATVQQYGADPSYVLEPTATSQLGYVGFQNTSGTIMGANGYGGSTYADLDLQDKVFVTSVGKVLLFARSDDVAATSVLLEVRDNYTATGTQVGGIYGDGSDFKSGITPTALSGDVNDYAGCTLSWCRISGGAANRNITGLKSGADGKIFNVCNVGTTNTLVLVDESASSTAANRFALDGDITIPVERCQRLVYDGTSSRWRAQQ